LSKRPPCVSATVCACHRRARSGGAAAATAYASNEGSGTVSRIDTATDRVTATITTGGKPRGIALSLDGTKLYLSDQEANALVVVDTAQKKQVAKVPLGDSPEAIYLSPDGKWLSAAIEENNEVVILDTATLAVVKRHQDQGQESRACRVEPRRQAALRERRGSRLGRHHRCRARRVVKSVKVGDRPRGIGFFRTAPARMSRPRTPTSSTCSTPRRMT
jgi:YVTN family beta-propeller protein